MASMIQVRKTGLLLIIISLLLTLLAYTVISTPVGPTVNYIKNTTMSTSGSSRADPGGYIHTVNLDGLQQNMAWKGYVGNVSGSYTLDDGSGATLYNWVLPDSMVVGEVYVSRNNSIDFSYVNCSNESLMDMENDNFGFSESDSDNINSTFNLTTHAPFYVGTRLIANSSCPALFTFSDDTYPTEHVNTSFQEVLLTDHRDSLIYVTQIESDATGFDNETYDFQVIVPENRTAATATTFYFYVEIGG